MKRIFFTVFILLFTLVLYAQRDTVFYKNEIRLSYGIISLPNGFRTEEKDIWKGGFTATYIYRVKKWFWVGGSVNWQFPSDLEYYRWREYYTDNTFKDFEISKRDKFVAIAPEIRFSHTHLKWAMFYTALSAGYVIHTGINKKNMSNDFLYDYWYWNITIFGANFHIGKTQNFFMGGEFGVGYKGTLMIHTGYRF